MASLLARSRIDEWIPAADLVSGARLEELFGLPEQLWAAPPHAAAVLAWKAYTYRLAQLLATAWTSNRQIPLLSAENVRFRVQPRAPYVMVDLRSQEQSDLTDEQSRLDFVRETMIDCHLKPLAEQVKEERRISDRVLWGQAATAIAYAFADVSPGATEDCARFTELLPITGLAGISGQDTVWQTTCCLSFASPALTACRSCVTAKHQRRNPPRLKSLGTMSRGVRSIDTLLGRAT